MLAHQDDSLDVLIEIPAWSFRKTSRRQRDADGAPVFEQEFFSLLPCPFNYGVAPHVPSADSEGQDVIVIGHRLRRGTRLSVRPRLRVVFVDQGLADDKLVARADGHALRWLDLFTVKLFFVVYSLFKRLRYRLQGQSHATTGTLRYETLYP